MRLIDADALVKELEDLRYTKESPSVILTPAGQEIYNDGVYAAIFTVMNATTTKFTLNTVVHARWIDSRQCVGFYMCSACKSGVKEHQPFYSNVWKYCPNCGARMDGEAHDDPG